MKTITKANLAISVAELIVVAAILFPIFSAAFAYEDGQKLLDYDASTGNETGVQILFDINLDIPYGTEGNLRLVIGDDEIENSSDCRTYRTEDGNLRFECYMPYVAFYTALTYGGYWNLQLDVDYSEMVIVHSENDRISINMMKLLGEVLKYIIGLDIDLSYTFETSGSTDFIKGSVLFLGGASDDGTVGSVSYHRDNTGLKMTANNGMKVSDALMEDLLRDGSLKVCSGNSVYVMNYESSMNFINTLAHLEGSR